MSDLMKFPNTVEEFMEKYKIVDTYCVYTNGVEMVPIFRMQQWFDHVRQSAEAMNREPPRCENGQGGERMIYNDCRDCAKYYGDCGKHHKDSHGHVNYRIPNMCYMDGSGNYCTVFQPSKNMYKEKCHMTIKEVISQLESLKADAVERIDPEDEDDIFKKDVEALEKAIAVLQFGVAARGESE